MINRYNFLFVFIACLIGGGISFVFSSDQTISSVSSSYLDRPYQLGALGEGESGLFDKDPLYREDVFDCMTFVETVLAHSVQSKYSVQDVLQKIRYKDGEISFKTRNHFISIDWIPNNMWLLRDITRDVFGNDILYTSTIVDKTKFFKKVYDTEFDFNLEKSCVSYYLIDHLTLDDIQKIPHESVLMIVRPNWNLSDKIGTNLDVSHLGFVIHRDEKVYFRHASTDVKKVVDVDLYEYLSQYKGHSIVKGISIYHMRDQVVVPN